MALEDAGDNAVELGGVAGHAGLFATAPDVARFARIMLAGGVTPEGRRVLRAETVAQFTAVSVAAKAGRSARALGWQALPTDEEVSSAGTLFGPRSYGHTGWTGTSLWIDPDRDVFVVLLTNRAYAPRGKSFTTLKQVRGRVADAAALLTAWAWRNTWYRGGIAVPASIAIGMCGLYWAIERTAGAFSG